MIPLTVVDVVTVTVVRVFFIANAAVVVRTTMNYSGGVGVID